MHDGAGEGCVEDSCNLQIYKFTNLQIYKLQLFSCVVLRARVAALHRAVRE